MYMYLLFFLCHYCNFKTYVQNKVKSTKGIGNFLRMGEFCKTKKLNFTGFYTEINTIETDLRRGDFSLVSEHRQILVPFSKLFRFISDISQRPKINREQQVHNCHEQFTLTLQLVFSTIHSFSKWLGLSEIKALNNLKLFNRCS